MPDRPAIGPVGVADALGWASGALGAPMLATPRRLLREIGVKPDGRAHAAVVFVGVREFVAMFTILGMRHRRVGAWSRVAGDLTDLSLLGSAWRSKRQDGKRLAAAASLVASILAADLLTAVRLSQAEGSFESDGSSSTGAGVEHEDARGPAHIRVAITVGADEEQVRRAFAEFEWSALDPASVRFAPAPGDRGTEVHVDQDPSVPGGTLGATALKLAGRSPDQQLSDELRRFKALLETGVEPRSEKTPGGISSAGQIFQRPAQPSEVRS